MNYLVRKLSSVWNLFRLALAGDESSILSGNIDRAIFLLAIPMTLEMMMESLFAIVDIFFVSKIGVNAIAVVGLTESMLTITYSLGWGLAMGTTAMIARRVGEQDNDGASIAAVQSILSCANHFYSNNAYRNIFLRRFAENNGRITKHN
ncbi:MAG: MATE family efflux transporter [Ignavibacteriales bacterium]|nr:MATE family efflux transporter [Ignavibacteriales bacterium]